MKVTEFVGERNKPMLQVIKMSAQYARGRVFRMGQILNTEETDSENENTEVDIIF
jgi:hypothetical protein